MASEAEETMRGAVEAKILELLPDARVIHELECGLCRADLAAVTPDKLLLFELKSARDKLARLPKQMDCFNRCCHLAVAVLDERFFDYEPYHDGSPRCASPAEADAALKVWRYPGTAAGTHTERLYAWDIRPLDAYRTMWQPDPRCLLTLMYADEQRAVLGRHGLPVKGPEVDRVSRLAYNLTGRQIAEETCRQLRSRPVLRGTPPVIDPEGIPA